MRAQLSSRCPDAVILIPGLMGSQLTDPDGRLIWGLSPRLLAKALTGGGLLRRLQHTPGDGVQPSGLLQAPALIPGLGSIDPYGALQRALRRDILTHPDALLGFAYDWRLSIATTARQLARAAETHLAAWRAHPHGNPRARLWLIGHSLGGLVARYFTDVLDGHALTHQTITLGTPHYGSLRALAALASGDVLALGLHATRVRDLARTLPSVHELCPNYACLTDSQPDTPRQPTAGDLRALGADPALTHAAAAVQHALHATAANPARCGRVRAQVGIAQPTHQSATIANGTLKLHEAIAGENRGGDGSVYRDAASPPGVQPDYLGQRHGRLASAPEAITYIHAALTERPLGPPMTADAPIGIAPPASVRAGIEFAVRVTAHPDQRVHVNAINDDTGRHTGKTTIATPADGELIALLTLPRPGLYTIQAKGGGASPVIEHILCTEPPALTD